MSDLSALLLKIEYRSFGETFVVSQNLLEITITILVIEKKS